MRMNTNLTTIDAYLTPQPPEIRTLLESIRRELKSVLPKEAEEGISYGMPTFKLYGKSLVYFAAFKNHIGFFPTSSGVSVFKDELAAYETSKGTIRLPLDKPLPFALMKKIALYRAKEVAESHGPKA